MAEGQCGEIQQLLDSHLTTAQDLCGRCDKQLHVKGKIFFFFVWMEFHEISRTVLIAVLYVLHLFKCL